MSVVYLGKIRDCISFAIYNPSEPPYGSRTLASYSYTDRTNYLGSLDYGNGDSVNYIYDQQGRVSQQTYEDGSTQYTDRETVYGLYGPATYVGASGGPSWYAGADLVSFSDASNHDIEANGSQITGGVGIGVDVHVAETYTKSVTNAPGKSIKSKQSNINPEPKSPVIRKKDMYFKEKRPHPD